MTPYGFEFLESAEKEFLALPHRYQRLFREKLLYLLRKPFRSYPWLRVRQEPDTRENGGSTWESIVCSTVSMG